MKNLSKKNKILVSGSVLGALCLIGLSNNAFASTPALLNAKTEVYKNASTSGGSHGSFDAKTAVDFEVMDGVWIKVNRTSGGKTYTGYTNIPKNVTLKDNVGVYINTKNGDSLWSDAKLTNEIVNTINYGTKITVAKFTASNKETSSAYVKTQDGKIGFIGAGGLSSVYIPEGGGGGEDDGDGGGGGDDSGQTESEQKITQMINLAKSKIGMPYVYGAEGPKKFDCTGLTYYLFKEVMKVTLKRSAASQGHDFSKFNKIESYSNLKAGDIIAFDFKQDGTCDHVGFYIGDSKMIEASNGAGVVREFDFYNKTNGSSYRTKYFMWGLRYKNF